MRFRIWTICILPLFRIFESALNHEWVNREIREDLDSAARLGYPE